MKKLLIFCLAVGFVFAISGMAYAARGGPSGDTVDVSWCEDAVRYDAVGNVQSSWQNDPIGPTTFVKTGKAYHIVDIQQYYNCKLDDLSGKLVISGSGNLSGHAKYTSGRSGLPIKETFKGEVTIDEETMAGTYTQTSYAYGSEADVLKWYPNSVAADELGWWFIGYTDYDAHVCP
jgi:hypothetical protein